MFRIPVKSRMIRQNSSIRTNSSSSFIRNTFIEYFTVKHGHKHIKSSSVVPLCDPTVPFVNAGMNQFKNVFLGKVLPPYPRVVNSQKCVRVGGKHNDLDIVGTDGHHHTFFEMLGNWSFGDYYKKEACQMAWDLLLGPYRLKPENLVVTYFSGDAAIGLKEDTECRDIWKAVGVSPSRIKGLGSVDNFWEMGISGPCGPCSEIHYINADGSLTEIWNLVFIQCNREADGKITSLPCHHVDTGMGLERMAALLQGVSSNYDTDLFQPIIKAIEQNSQVSTYGGRFGSDAPLDSAYRRLADHARMISVCLADGVFPATSLNLKQIMRKSFKISIDMFQNPHLLTKLYNEVAASLGPTYPELVAKEKEAKIVIEHELQSYRKMRADLRKKWKNLLKQYPEVENLSDVELSSFALGYKEFKETMSKQKTNVIPGELVFKLYDTYGFQEDVIKRIGNLNNLDIDKQGFWKLLSQHKSRHKTAFKEQASNKGLLFDKAIEKLRKSGFTSTNDQPKYIYTFKDDEIKFEPLKTKIAAILNENCEWIDILEPCENRPYYIVTEYTNFFCEEGGQIADSGIIRINEDLTFNVNSVFKIRDFVFHKGSFSIKKNLDSNYVKRDSGVILEINSDKRLKVMRNHTAVHLLNAAVRQVLPNSVVYQTGSGVTDKGLYLTLSVYGQKVSEDVVAEAQELVRKSIESNAEIETRVVDSVQLSLEPSVLTVPGEIYPETGLRVVQAQPPLASKELCCGTHVPFASVIGDFYVTLVKGAGSNTPTLHAVTGDTAEQVSDLFNRAKKLEEIVDLVDPDERKTEAGNMKKQLSELCNGSGAPYGEYAQCLSLLDVLQKKEISKNDMALQAIAEAEIREASLEAARAGRRFVVHFLRCSYLMQSAVAVQALAAACRPHPAPAASPSTPATPAMLLGCAGGQVSAACTVPKEMVTKMFTAERWLSCILPVFDAQVLPTEPGQSPLTYAEMTATKVSLITCEQQVQDAMRVAIKFAQSHMKGAKGAARGDGGGGQPSLDRRQN